MPAVLAVFNWPKGSDRYRRIERFTERLFTMWDQFLIAPRHPKWRDVNLGATVPGWTLPHHRRADACTFPWPFDNQPKEISAAIFRLS